MSREPAAMKVKIVLNNNVLLAVDDTGQELVLRGKSLGFAFKKGDVITHSDAEFIYSRQDKNESALLDAVFPDVPDSHFRVSQKIVGYAQEKLNIRFSLSQFISLVDHITFALNRHAQGLSHSAPVYPILRHMFPQEYAVGLEAVKLLREEAQPEIPSTEAYAMAMHLVNAFPGQHDAALLLTHTRTVEQIINIVRLSFDYPINEETVSFSRFVTHLQFFIQRVINNEFSENAVDDFFDDVIANYAQAYRCACRIRQFVEQSFSITLGNEELLYLTIHVNRITA